MNTADEPMMLPVDAEEAATAVESAGGDAPPSAEEEAAKLEAQKKAPTLEGSLGAACGKAGPNLENRRVNDASSPNTALQRSGSSTSCGSPGQLNPADDAIYYCYTWVGTVSWTYLQSLRAPNIKGWVRDDLLRLNPSGASRGSIYYCGF